MKNFILYKIGIWVFNKIPPLKLSIFVDSNLWLNIALKASGSWCRVAELIFSVGNNSCKEVLRSSLTAKLQKFQCTQGLMTQYHKSVCGVKRNPRLSNQTFSCLILCKCYESCSLQELSHHFWPSPQEGVPQPLSAYMCPSDATFRWALLWMVVWSIWFPDYLMAIPDKHCFYST